MSHARSFTSNNEASYQINGKVATSKGGGKGTSKTFRVGRFAPSCSLAHNKNILYTNILIWNIFKGQTLCTCSYRNESHYNEDTFSKSLSKTHSTNTSLSYFQNKHFVRVLIETRAITKKTPFQNLFQKHIPQAPLWAIFSKHHFVRILIETRTITKIFLKYFQKPHHKNTFKQKQVI